MNQANKRGTFEERRELAIAKKQAQIKESTEKHILKLERQRQTNIGIVGHRRPSSSVIAALLISNLMNNTKGK